MRVLLVRRQKLAQTVRFERGAADENASLEARREAVIASLGFFSCP
jgi:hypothetical protein